MAIDAHRNLGVTNREALAVHTGVVLVQLVRAQAGVELANVRGIRMATSAQLRDLFAINLPLPSCLAAHGLVGIVAARIAAVTTGASQTLLCVDVLAELLLAHTQGLRQGGVTIQARVRGLSITKGRSKHQEAERHSIAGCAEPSELISQDGHKHSYPPRTQ